MVDGVRDALEVCSPVIQLPSPASMTTRYEVGESVSFAREKGRPRSRKAGVTCPRPAWTTTWPDSPIQMATGRTGFEG